MRFMLLASVLAMPASAAPISATPTPTAPPSPVCKPTAAQLAAERASEAHRPLFHKLTELPPADMYAAVFRHDANGCESPMVVRYDVSRKR
jgi:hypothetical protein